MPNHISHIVRIKGDIPALTTMGFFNPTPEENQSLLDCNGLIPMPTELKGTRSPIQIVDTETEAAAINYAHQAMLDQDIGGISRYMKPGYQAITQETADTWREEYGAADWYKWSINNWGTKWGFYDTEILHSSDELLVFKADTAWCTPDPIWAKLRDMGYDVDGLWNDEGDGEVHEIGDAYRWFSADIHFSYWEDSFTNAAD